MLWTILTAVNIIVAVIALLLLVLLATEYYNLKKFLNANEQKVLSDIEDEITKKIDKLKVYSILFGIFVILRILVDIARDFI